jgi:hypothetical protein
MRPADGLISTLAALLDPLASFVLAAILVVAFVISTAMRHRPRTRG